MPEGELVQAQLPLLPDKPFPEFRKLDVSIRDNDYVAGKPNITAIVIRNTYPDPVRILAVTARHSSLNTATTDAVYTGSLDKGVQQQRRENKFKFRIPYFEWQHTSSNDRPAPEPLYISAENGSKLRLNSDIPVDRVVYITAKTGAEVIMTEPQEQSTSYRPVTVSPSSEIVSEYKWRTNKSISHRG